MKIIAVVNNRDGVGKTSLVYHLAWMYADLDYTAVVADLDPHANLTSLFLTGEALERRWADGAGGTIHAAVQSVLERTGEVTAPLVTEPTPGLGLVAGDILLAGAEDELASQWAACLEGEPHAFRALSAVWQALRMAAKKLAADLVLVDVGSNLGALTRAAVIAADHVVVPLAPDLFSVRALRNLGPTLSRWRREWAERLERKPAGLALPTGAMQPIGYVTLRYTVRLTGPFPEYERWMDRIPGAYREFVIGAESGPSVVMEADPHCLAHLENFLSLVQFSEEARKPMFALKPADGVLGSHARVVRDCYRDFRALAGEVARRCGVTTA